MSEIPTIISLDQEEEERILGLLQCLNFDKVQILYPEKNKVPEPEVVPRFLIITNCQEEIFDENSVKYPYWLRKNRVPTLAFSYGLKMLASELGLKILNLEESFKGIKRFTENKVAKERYFNSKQLVLKEEKLKKLISAEISHNNKDFIVSLNDKRRNILAIEYLPCSREYPDFNLIEKFVKNY